MHKFNEFFNNKLSFGTEAVLLLLSIQAVTFAQGQWKCATSAAKFSIRQGHESVVFQDKVWILNGYHQKTNYYDIWNSSNGTDWTKVADDSALYPMHAHHPTVVNDGYIWILGGEPGC